MLIEISVALVILLIIGALLVGAWDWAERIVIIVVGVIFGFFGWFIVCIVLSFLVALPMNKHFTTENRNLAVLQDGNQLQGSFFLGIGSIDGVPKYTFYAEHNGGKKLESIDADTVTVFEDTDAPYLVQQTGCKTSMEWLAHCYSDKRVTEIHVPKDTIKGNFVLDAQ
jgi:hypothetical protein